MTERPIFFNGDMVRAILAGQKTVTRRPVNPQPIECIVPEDIRTARRVLVGDTSKTSWSWRGVIHEPFPSALARHSPAGRAGDLLYVRETWRAPAGLDSKSPKAIADACLDANWEKPWCPIWYAADDHYNRAVSLADVEREWGGKGKVRPSAHMPKWAARIWLRVTSVRVERLQGITNKQAMAEGFEGWYAPAYVGLYGPVGPDAVEPVEDYREDWDDIYGKQDGLSWKANPWVWVFEFERVEAAT